MPPDAVTFTTSDALSLYTLISSIIIPFVVSWLKKRTWPPSYKITMAVLFSFFGAILARYASGEPMLAGSITATALTVFTAAQAHYVSWFAALGIDQKMNQEPLNED